MGIIIGKFRKKKSTYDILEKLEKEITCIEEFGRSTEQTRKKIVGRFVLLAVTVYVILAFILYVYYHKISAYHKLICVTPLMAFPLIIWLIKRFLTWYYSRKIKKNEKKLVSLKDEKKKILDNVKETETYIVAKKILDKFGNDQLKKPRITLSESTPITSKTLSVVPSTIRPNQPDLRQRYVGPSSIMRGRLSFGEIPTPGFDRKLVQAPGSPAIFNKSASGVSMTPYAEPISGTPLHLPRNILPRDRSVLDRMVDYLVGDGPSNRYALICKSCFNHNGMALKEEFEYLSFRCCYCSAFNPALKKRPTGPKFEANISHSETVSSDSSDSDKNSVTDSQAKSTKAILSKKPRSSTPDIKTVTTVQPVEGILNEQTRSDSPDSAAMSEVELSEKPLDDLTDTKKNLDAEMATTDVEYTMDEIVYPENLLDNSLDEMEVTLEKIPDVTPETNNDVITESDKITLK